MRIRLSDHAVLRIRQRLVRLEDVRRTLEDPDDRFVGRDGLEHHVRECAAGALVVVAWQDDDAWVVVTVLWDDTEPRPRRKRGR